MGALNRKSFDKWAGPMLGLIALVVYFFTLSDGAFPGESANLIAEHTGLTPSLSARMPIWRFCVWIISALFGDNFVFGLNLFSAVCGSLSVFLIYGITADLIMMAADTSFIDETVAIRGSRLAGLAASLMLAFCCPFWIVSTRLHMLSFDVLILLGVVRILLDHASKGGLLRAWIFALCYGIGIVEYQTLILFAPLCGGFLLFNMWRQEQISARNITVLVVCGLAGLMMYLPAAGLFCRTPGYDYFAYRGFFHVLWTIWREQYGLMSGILPKVGWAIILIFTAAPWLTAVIVARRALNEENVWGDYVLHIVMTVLAICVLVNASFAPWPSLGVARMMVTPYLLSSMTIGYLVAYWYILPTGWWRDAEADKPGRVWIRRNLGSFLTGLLFITLLIMPFLNGKIAHGKHSSLINAYVSEVLDSIGDRNWLITDGSFDSEILLAAKSQGRKIQTINTAWGNNAAYMRYVDTILNDNTLRNCARISMDSLLNEWFSRGPDAVADVAVLAHTDLWAGKGIRLLPKKMALLCKSQDEALNPGALLEEHRAFWQSWLPVLQLHISKKGLTSNVAMYIARQMGKNANNLGFFLEEEGHEQEAAECYTKAREIDIGNMSALLNMALMLQRGVAVPNAGDISARMNKLIMDPNRYSQIWNLSRTYGYIRKTDAFIRSGRTWAAFGRPDMAISDLETAMDIMPDSQKHKVQELLGMIEFSLDDSSSSEKIFQQLLEENPQNKRALIGMAKISRREKKYEECEKWLEKADAAGVNKTMLYIEQASLHIARNSLEEAGKLLHELIELAPDSLQAWAMLAGVLSLQNDEKGFENCLRNMKRFGNAAEPMICTIMAQKAFREKDYLSAYDNYRQVLKSKPNDILMLEQTLQLAVMLRKREDAEIFATRIISLDSGNAVGNYVIASLMLYKGHPDSAEECLRRSIAREKTAPALNDLAWLLQGQGELDEAENLVRESLKIRELAFGAWDTLGVILMKKGNLEEARSAFQRSIELFKNDPRACLHLAELELKSNNLQEAKALLLLVKNQQSFLSIEDKATLKELIALVNAE